MRYRTFLVFFCSVVVVLLLGQVAYAQPYVDTGFTYSTPTDIDLVIVRENYDDTEYQQAVYFRMNADGGVLYEMSGIITFPPGISIVDVYYRRADNQPANSDIPWAISGSNYSGDARGLEDNQDPILWDENTISFRTYFAGLDDFRVIVDYGDSFPSGVSFDIELLTGPASETDYSTGIQVGNIDGVVPGSGDFGEITQLTVPLTPPLVGYWNFDENTGTTVYDGSGYGNDGQIDGATWVPGKCGSALSFDGGSDGSKDFVNIPDTGLISIDTSPFTISFWIKFFDLDKHHTILDKRHGYHHHNYWFSYYDKDQPPGEDRGDYLMAGINDTTISTSTYDEGPYARVDDPELIKVNQYYYVTATYDHDSGDFILYLDGNVLDTKNIIFSNPVTGDGDLYIGAHPFHGVDYATHGIIDEVRIYNYALTQEQIRVDMAACLPEIDIITPPDYEVTYIQIGDKYYLDRDYTVTSIPTELSLGTEKWIKTKNDDKRNTSYPFLEFTIHQENVVYVAYDSRAISLPSWLDDFEATSQTIGVSEGMGHFNVYKKSFPAGTVTLGGNKAGGAAGVSSNYIVIVQPSGPGPEICDNGMDDDEDGLVDLSDPDCPCTDADSDTYYAQGWCGTTVDCDDNDPNIYPGAMEVCDDTKDNDCDGAVDCEDPDCEMEPACSELVTINAPSSCGLGDLQEGDMCYRDRNYTLTSIPDELSTGTEKWIMPNNDDKRNTSACFLEFEIIRDCVVYVAYDSRAISLPSWLESFDPTSMTIGVSDAAMDHFTVYKKSFPAGTICLGGNMASGAAGVGSNYLVIVQPSEPSKEICDNGMDDDLDGFVDCEDPDCSEDIACPNVLYVDGQVASSGNGTNWNEAFKTIQEALDAAAGNGTDDLIRVQQGTYNGNFMYSAPEAYDVTIEGGYTGDGALRVVDPVNTVLDGGSRTIDSTGGNVTIDGFTIQNGGGIQIYESSPKIMNCTITGNGAIAGGGIWIGQNSSPTISSCSLINNVADNGGAISISASYAIITDCTFYKNEAMVGGAIDASGIDTDVIITNSTFIENWARVGGAIHASNLTATKSSFIGNVASRSGGAIAGGGKITNCIFYDNYVGWGSHTEHPYQNGFAIKGSTEVTNCIIWWDEANVPVYPPEWPIHQIYVDPRYGEPEPVVTYSNIVGGYPGEGNIEDDPLFVDPYNEDFRIQRSSPCIDAGDPVERLTADYSAGGVVLEVDSVTNISAGDTAWVTDGVNTESDEVVGTSTTTITVANGFTNSYLVKDNAYVYTELSDFAEESWPNGGRINLGAYGGTSDSTISVPPSHSIVTVHTPTNYLESKLQVGDKYYTDRDYITTSIPSELSSGIEKWIMSKNDYKNETSESFLKFTLLQDSVVYVAYDSRAISLPDWLGSFEPTSLTIELTDVQMGHFKVYKKTLAAGPVTLGGNRASGAVDAYSSYVVIVQPIVMPNVVVLKPPDYEVAGLKEGDKYYLDRNYTLISIPAELSTGAEEWIKTRNNDKRNTSACFLEFTIQQESIVYLGYDSRASLLPSWLDDFEPTSQRIGVSDAAMGHFNVFKKSFSAGTVCLGGNMATGATNVESNYIVIVQTVCNIGAAGVWHGDYEINTATDLQTLSGFTSVTGNLVIRDSDLTSLEGLECLANVSGDLTIENNDSLTNLLGLKGIRSVGRELRIELNASLKTLEGFREIRSVGKDLKILNNASLTSLAGLESLQSIGEDLKILNNDSLTSLAGLESLQSVGEDLWIEGNDSLTSLAGLESLKSVRYLWIVYNDSLTSLVGLEGLQSVGELLVGYNASLNSLAGLESLQSVGGDLRIERNESLTSLAGLESLKSVGGDLQVWNNDSLTSLAGLESLQSIGEDLKIHDNPELCTSSAEALRDQVENAGGIGGTMYIHDNKDC